MTTGDQAQKTGPEAVKKGKSHAKRPAAAAAARKKPAANKVAVKKTVAKKTAALGSSPASAVKAAGVAQNPWEQGFNAWRAGALRGVDTCLDAGCATTITTIEFCRRNVMFQQKLIQVGLEAARGLRH